MAPHVTEGESRRVSFARMLAFRLGSEAAGQLGAFGQVFGEALRVSGLGRVMPISSRITSVVLDRALFILSGALVTIAGMISVLFLLPLPHKVSLYVRILAWSLGAVILLAVVVVRGRWAVFSGPARAMARLGPLGRWVAGKQSAIVSVENQLLDFCDHGCKRFWGSFVLNLAAHLCAILEVYLILRLMGEHVGIFSAFAVEALTKVINAIGLFNPGNIGTYEGGNMLLARFIGLSGAAGLTLALVRRIRTLFWAAMGVLCMAVLPKQVQCDETGQSDVQNTNPVAKHESDGQAASQSYTAILLAEGIPSNSLLCRVGNLPVLLRAIISAQKSGAARIVVVLDQADESRIHRELANTRRLPRSIEWHHSGSGEIAHLLQNLTTANDRVVLIGADRTYHPSLHRQAAEWMRSMALALTTGDEPVGIYVLPIQVLEIAKGSPSGIRSLEELHQWLLSTGSVICTPVPEELWQRVRTPEDRRVAERKLDRWLVKPTDGVFARMNRKISIPISRQLIKFPITPNMVSLFTLCISLLSGVFFAFGERTSMLVGALLSVFASILDGCDGEVARLKLQDSAFGCWLETVCDDLYYFFIFVGMTVGLLRRGPVYLIWGAMLLFGAAATILITTLQRRRLAGAHPEQYLRIWQAQAAKRRSNPFLYLGRRTEFLMRRCCLPYVFLFFALLGITHFPFIGAAVGVNVAWPIALYSYITLHTAQTRAAWADTNSRACASPADIHG